MDIAEISKMVNRDGIIFLSYGGFLSQTLISAMTEALEKEAEYSDVNMTMSTNIYTIFIELSQNMMNYSKSIDKDSDLLRSEGLILVSKEENGSYAIHSQNIISLEDKTKILPVLSEIQTMNRDELKQRYRELRKSGKNTHGKGGGIGFYEIAKRCDFIEFSFTSINEDRFYFHLKTIIKKEVK